MLKKPSLILLGLNMFILWGCPEADKIKQLDELLRTAQDDLQKANEKANTEQCRANSLNDEITTLRGQIAVAQSTINEKSNDIATAQTNLNRTQLELQQKQRELTTAQNNLAQAQRNAAADATNAAAQLQAARTQLATAQTNLANAQRDYTAAQATITNLRAQVARAQTAQADAEAALATNQAEVARFRAAAATAAENERRAIQDAEAARAALTALREAEAARLAAAGGAPNHNAIIQRAIDDVPNLDPGQTAERGALEEAAKNAETAAEVVRVAAGAYAPVDDAAAQARKAELNAIAPNCYINRVNDAVARAQELARPDLKNFPNGRAVVNNLQTVESFLQAIENECVRINAPLALNGRTKDQTLDRVRAALQNRIRGWAQGGWPVAPNNLLATFLQRYVEAPVPPSEWSLNYRPTGTGFTLGGGIDVSGVRKAVFSGFGQKLIQRDNLAEVVPAATLRTIIPFKQAFTDDNGYSINGDFTAFARCIRPGEAASAENCYNNIGTAIGKFLSIEERSYAMLSIPLSTYLYERILGNNPESLVELLAIMKVQNPESFNTFMNTLSLPADQVEFVGDFDFTGLRDTEAEANIQRVWAYNVYDYVKAKLSYELIEKPGDKLTSFLAAFHQMVPLNLLRGEVTAGRLNNNTLKLALQSTKIEFDEFSNKLGDGGANYTLFKEAVRGILENGCPAAADGAEPIVFDDFLGSLIQWWTGSRSLPAPGERQLTIRVLGTFDAGPNNSWESLPNSHTCFNALDIPNYHTLGTGLGLSEDQIVEHIKKKLCVGTENGLAGGLEG